MRFKCGKCAELHEGVPGFAWDYPTYYLTIPETERERRCNLTSDTCTVDDKHFFVRGCLEVPVHDEQDPFVWGVWVSLSAPNFQAFVDVYTQPHRSQVGPFFGWLQSHIRLYPETCTLKARVHLRDQGTRPYIELEPTDHPLAIEQREGITRTRVIYLFEEMSFPTALDSGSAV